MRFGRPAWRGRHSWGCRVASGWAVLISEVSALAHGLLGMLLPEPSHPLAQWGHLCHPLGPNLHPPWKTGSRNPHLHGFPVPVHASHSSLPSLVALTAQCSLPPPNTPLSFLQTPEAQHSLESLITCLQVSKASLLKRTPSKQATRSPCTLVALD